MARVITKKKKNICQEELMELCKEIMENKEDPIIMGEKFIKLKKYCQEFSQYLKEFNNILKKYSLPLPADNSLENFAKSIDSFLLICETYKQLKNSDIYVLIIQTCVLFKNVFEDIERNSKNDTPIMKIFEFSSWNFKDLFINDLKEEEIKESLGILGKLNTVCQDFSEEIFLPDMDIKKFHNLILNALDILEKKIPKCKSAFYSIRQSVELFNNNFAKYNKEAKIIGNNLQIMQFFIQDIADSPEVLKSSRPATLKREFKVIINHISMLYSSNFKNQPQAAKLIQMALSSL